MSSTRYEAAKLYRNKKTGAVIIQPMSRHPTGALADFGEPEIVSEAEFDSRIVDAVLENLAKFDRDPFRHERAKTYADEEYTRFTREHDTVSVYRKETGILELHPSRRAARRHEVGYEGINDAVITLREDEIRDKLAGAIRKAFERVQ